MFKKIHVEIKILQFLKKCLQQTLTKIKKHKQARQKNGAENLLFISFHDDGVYLNEVKIIDKKAGRRRNRSHSEIAGGRDGAKSPGRKSNGYPQN